MSLAFSASRTPMTTSSTARRVSVSASPASQSLWLPSSRQRRPALEVSLDRPDKSWQHLYVLPVLLLEFLAIALTRAVLPALLLEEYGDRIYLVMGFADFVKGLLAFFTCPLFGRASDIIGRRLCLFITVMGTCAPICTLALFHWNKSTLEEEELASTPMEDGAEEAHGFPILWPFGAVASDPSSSQHPYAITVFVVLLALSGVFSSTFPLVFAYISDTVKEQEERVSAYGLALATFGLSFTLGPMIGGYLAKTDKQYVFLTSLLLTVLDLLYIYLILPESKKIDNHSVRKGSTLSLLTQQNDFSWNPVDIMQIILVDPLLQQVGKVAFLYYTGLWALISTISVYAVKRFHLRTERLGELISVLGFCTMVAEAVLVRIVVPMLGEKRAIKLGLVSFALQCIVLGFAYESWHLFVCAAFSLLGNLVYPSLSSLVSGSVEPDAVGEALGAINGIKALTEGIGPLVFGSLMTISEKSALPGWPYLLAAVLVAAAYKESCSLPDPEDDNYIHELERKKPRCLMKRDPADDTDEEAEGLLSDVDESWNHLDDFVEVSPTK